MVLGADYENKRLTSRPGAVMPPADLELERQNLFKEFPEYYAGAGCSATRVPDEDVSASLLYPKVFRDFLRFRITYCETPATKSCGEAPVVLSKTDLLPTVPFLYGMEVTSSFRLRNPDILNQQKEVVVKLLRVSGLGFDAVSRDCVFEISSENITQKHTLKVVDNSRLEKKYTGPMAEGKKGEVASPLAGTVLSTNVRIGDRVNGGTPMLVLSAMKLEVTIKAPPSSLGGGESGSYVVDKILVEENQEVVERALLVVLRAVA